MSVCQYEMYTGVAPSLALEGCDMANPSAPAGKTHPRKPACALCSEKVSVKHERKTMI